MKNRITRRTLLSFFYQKWQVKFLLLVMGVAIVMSAVIFTNIIVAEIIKREQNSVRLYADIYKQYLDPNTNPELLDLLSSKIFPVITFPIIMTDENDEPIFPYESWSMNVKIDSTLKIDQQRVALKKIITKMGGQYKPFVTENEGKILNKFYYSHSSLVEQLKLFPYVEILIIGFFIFIGYIAFSNIRKSEESKVWVGMAKEAAHQLGTPLSSLLAWIEILKYTKDEPDSIEETVSEMEKDINRLNIIATRFSKIGSLPEMTVDDVTETIENVCLYFEKRLPHLGRKVEIQREKHLEPVKVLINSELFAWVIENLLKNAAESIDNKRGFVKIEIDNSNKNKVLINITDNGKGMNMKQKSSVFNPGFTTKKRGWGLGLTLSKRIVEEYHKGKLYVKESIPNKGTTFTIELSKAVI